MKSKGMTPMGILCLCLALLVVGSTPALAQGSDDLSEPEFTPTEIHEHLIKSKLRSAADQRFASELVGQGAESQTDYDVKFYDVYIRVNDTTEVIYGTVTMEAEIVTDGVAEMWVDFYNNMTVDATVLNGSAVGFGWSGNQMRIILDRTYNTGENVSLRIQYHGHPIEGGFQAFAFSSSSGLPVISTLSEPYFARTWWPCKDRMDDKPDSMDIAIEVANEFYVGSNGTLDSVTSHTPGTSVHYYTVRYPMATYLFSLAISVYSVWTQEYVYNGGADTMPIVHAVFPAWDDYSRPRFGITPDAIAILENVFGPYPFLDEKYGHSNFTWGGGMEHQTMTSMGANSFGFSEPVVVHELGHQWWGDMITCKSWHDIWLNEGWASYSEALYYEAQGGFTSLRNYMASMDYDAGGSVWREDTNSVGSIFNLIVYHKGAWVCHMLRGVLGDEAFFQAVDDYYHSEYQYGALNSEEFKNLFEQSSGQELDWFFEDWLYGEYRPNYLHYVHSQPSDLGGYDTWVVIKQIQATDPPVFRMPIDIKLVKPYGPVEEQRIFNDQRRQAFYFNTNIEVVDVNLDTDAWILKYTNPLQPWQLFILTPEGPLKAGMELAPYNDTIDALGGDGSFEVSVIGGSLPPGVTAGNDGVLSGIPAAMSDFTFTLRFYDPQSGFQDEGAFSIHIDEALGIPGELTGDGQVELADILYLANYLFLGGPPLVEPRLADVDNNCYLDLGDVLNMAYSIYLGGPPLTIGCAE